MHNQIPEHPARYGATLIVLAALLFSLYLMALAA